MRAIWAAVVVIGCGGSPAPEDAKPIVRLDLPALDESAGVTVLTKAKPAAIVWLTSSGGAIVREGGSWRGELAAPRKTEREDVRAALIEAVLGGKTSLVDDAYQWMNEVQLAELSADRTTWPPRGSLRLRSARSVPLQGIDKLAPLVIATPSAPASKLARVIQEVGGVLAVDHLGQLAVLDLAFDRERTLPANPATWIEVWIDASGLHLTTQPEDKDVIVPYAGMQIDRAGLQNTWRKLDLTKVPVDVLVRSDTTVQTLVDVLAALRAVGIESPSVAVGPDSMTARAEQIKTAKGGMFGQPSAIAGTPNVQGDLDKPTIRFTVLQRIAEIRGCYESKLAANPSLAGIVQTQFFITPDGTVASAVASGVDAEVSNCIATVILTIKFPKPDGGAGVQVNYPFTFRTGSP